MATTVVRWDEAQVTHVFDGQLVPTVLTDLITRSILVTAILLVNVHATAVVQVTVQDRQATPRAFAFNNVRLGPGGNVMLERPEGLLATNGLSWISDTLNAVVGRVEYRELTITI